MVESEAEFEDIDFDDSIEEVEGHASLLFENEDNDYVGEEESKIFFFFLKGRRGE